MSKKMVCACMVMFIVFCQVGYCKAFNTALTHGVFVKISNDIAPDMDCKWILGTEAYRSMSEGQKEFIQWFIKYEYHKSLSDSRYFTFNGSRTKAPIYVVQITTKGYRIICLRAITEDNAVKMAEALTEYVMPEITAKRAQLEQKIHEQGVVVNDCDAKIIEYSQAQELAAKEHEACFKNSGYEHQSNSVEIREKLEGKLDEISIKVAGIEAKKKKIMRVLDILNQKISKIVSGPGPDEDYRKGLITMKLKYEEQQIDLDIELSGVDGENTWAMKKLSQMRQYDKSVSKVREAELGRSKYVKFKEIEREKLDQITGELASLVNDNKQIISQDLTVSYLK